MIVEYIRYKIPGERQREFEEAYSDASQSLNASKHCQMYELTHCAEELGSLHTENRMGLA